MKASTRRSSPRRRRPRDPRIGNASNAADQAKRQMHPDSQTPSATALAVASADGQAVRAWYAARPAVLDAKTGRPPTKKTHRRFATKVQVSYRRPSPPTSPPSPWTR